jgi:type II secretory pathway pseudopilin PulG
MSVLTAMGAPRFMRAIEQSRVDVAAANLRAIWTAQRLYWLKHLTYAHDVSSLISDVDGENFLDPHVSSTNATYVCVVTFPTEAQPSATNFTATATRPDWTGSLSIGIDGSIPDRSIPDTDHVVDPSGTVYKPSPSFQ